MTGGGNLPEMGQRSARASSRFGQAVADNDPGTDRRGHTLVDAMSHQLT
jgi:hypothetical protein